MHAATGSGFGDCSRSIVAARREIVGLRYELSAAYAACARARSASLITLRPLFPGFWANMALTGRGLHLPALVHTSSCSNCGAHSPVSVGDLDRAGVLTAIIVATGTREDPTRFADSWVPGPAWHPGPAASGAVGVQCPALAIWPGCVCLEGLQDGCAGFDA